MRVSEEDRLIIRKLMFRSRHLRTIVTLVGRESELRDAIRQAVTSYGIRDWAREPFGAGCHVWQPGVESWKVRERLAAFGANEATGPANIHICGEAFSDYQGFIEGALRSTDDALRASLLLPATETH